MINNLKEYLKLLVVYVFVFINPILGVTTIQECNLPPQYKVQDKTFVINPALSCATNIFLHVVPSFASIAESKFTAEEMKKNPQIAGRLAYELLGNEFAKNKPNIETTDLKIPGKDSTHEVPVRLYKGTDSERFILFIHGGGWSRGNLETHDTLCRKLSEATKATVLAVDYRLSPEHPYPAGLEDAEAAYKWFVEKHVQNKKIFIAGDSGGGNITSGLVIKFIKEKKRTPDGAILFYPALDLRIPEKTANPYSNGYFLTRDSINAYVNNYTHHNQELAKDPTVSPILAIDEDLSKFPPVILVNAECDPLTEEGTAFAKRLKSLGIYVDHKVIPKTIHVFAQYFDILPEATQAIEFVRDSFENVYNKPAKVG